MADEKETTWKLNLDAKDALDAIGDVKGGLTDAFSTDNIGELLGKFAEVGVALGALSAAALVVKEAFDLTLEGEQIDAVNQQFETLSSNAGIFGDDLKDALEKSSGGLVDETNLLKGASQALVGLGSNAKELPEIMTVARQATAVFGGDLMTNFGNITQAIESGNVRMLKHYGIIVDQQKAYSDYAKQIGVATNELSKEGQQHAILNATLAQSKTAFDGINPDIMQTTNAFEAFKATLTDLKDLVAEVISKTLGPTFATFFTSLRGWLSEVKTQFEANFGGGADAASAKAKILQDQLLQLKGKLADIEVFDKQTFLDKWFGPPKQQQIAKLKNQIVAVEGELKGISVQQEKNAQASIDSDNKAQAANEINLKKREADLLKFQQQVDKLRQQNLTDEMKAAQSIDQVNKIHEQQVLLTKQQQAAEIKKIQTQEGLDEKQKNTLIEQINKQTELKLMAMDQQLLQERTQALDNYVSHSESASDSIVRAFAAGSAKNKANLHDFGQLGKATFDSFSKNAVGAFEAIGDGSKTVQQALLQMFLGPLSDIAIQQGTFMLLSGIWPPNPAALAGGAALIALGGALKALAGGGGGGGAPAPSAAANSSVTGYGTSAETPSVGSIQSPTNLQQIPQKTVNLTVQGNYYDTQEAQTAMMDMIRQSTDSTDFNYFKVGGQ